MGLPENFDQYLEIRNAPERLAEAMQVAGAIQAVGVELLPNLDHAAIFTDPPLLVAGPMKQLGYISGWDGRCYPSPVDGHDYINVSARLPAGSPRRDEGWPDYIAVVHPVDVAARNHMLSQGYGNPFIHHLTWGIVPPPRAPHDEMEYANTLIRFMTETRAAIQRAVGQQPGRLIIALPQNVTAHQALAPPNLPPDEFQIEAMEGGGFLLQFFVLTGGRIELALRVDTKQTFNPKSVDKISRNEISAVQTSLRSSAPPR
jgi:hypothetical protein